MERASPLPPNAAQFEDVLLQCPTGRQRATRRGHHGLGHIRSLPLIKYLARPIPSRRVIPATQSRPLKKKNRGRGQTQHDSVLASFLKCG
jgi:hypothetical protein